MTDDRERLAGALPRIAVILILLVPLAAWPRVWPLQSGVQDGLTILLAMSLGATGLIAIRRGALAIPGVALPLALFVLSTVLSGLAGDYVITTGLRWQLFTLAALMIALIGLGRVRDDLGDTAYTILIARGLLASGVVYAVTSLLLHYGVIGSGVTDSRLDGLWGQPNLTTTALWLTLFAALFLTARGGHRAVFVACVLLLSLGCALAASRLNLLFLVLAAALAGCAWRYGRDASTRRQGRWLAAAIAAIAIALVAVPPTARLIERQATSSDPQQAGLAERTEFDRPRVVEHRKILASLPDWSPTDLVLGVGPGNYAAFSFGLPVQPKNAAGKQNTWLHSHNIFSTVFVEQGLVGVLTLLAILALVGRRLWRIRHAPHAFPLAASLGILFLHSNVEFPLWYPWFAFVAIALAVPLSGTWRPRVDSPRILAATGVVIIAFVIGVGWNLGHQAWRIVTVARAAAPDRDDAYALKRLQHDGLMGPYATLVHYRRFSPDTGRIETGLERAAQTAAWRPLDLVKVRETMLLMMAGRDTAACTAARRTTERYPAAGPILLQKTVAAGMRFDIDPGTIAGCIERGLAVWGEDIGSMQQRNRDRIERMTGPEP